MKCRACKCVWYCDKDCQNRHWKEHKKECRRIKVELDKRGGKLDLGTEEEVGPLGKLPPRGEECPICMIVMPINERLRSNYACCGKSICCGCDMQHQIKSGERAGGKTCAFCRTKLPKFDEEVLSQLRKRVELKDPKALDKMAMHHGYGHYGLPVDEAKCIELLRESAGLGFPGAQAHLGFFHYEGEMGLEENEEEGLKYVKEAAKGGDFTSLHNLGITEARNGNDVAATRHWRLSASGGYRDSMRFLIEHSFEDGLLHHADLAETLQAMYLARAEMRSEERDQYIKYLKMKGEHEDYT
jgi:hypothetical protein